MIGKKKTVFLGAKVVTMWDELPEAEAVCVSDGRIECVGSEEDVLRFAAAGGTAPQRVELQGVLYPGFIDTHSHLSSYAECLDQAFCGSSRGSVEGVIQAVRAHAARNPGDEWVVGYGYDDTGIADKRHLNRHDLDKACPDRPAYVKHISVHMGYVNTLGLQRLGITADSRFAGGEVHLDERGEPDGFLLENAFYRTLTHLPALSPERFRHNLRRAVAEYNQKGFTTIQDGAVGLNGDAAGTIAAYAELARSKGLNARVYLQPLTEAMDDLLRYGLWEFGSDRMVLGGVKYFTDGSIQGYTGALLEDYYSRPGWKGELTYPQQEIDATILKYFRTGMQIAVHVNGDAAIEATLQAFEKARAACPGVHTRHLFVHAQTASDAQLMRMKACRIVPTLFARHIEVWGDRHYSQFLGPERASRLDPAGSCVRLGIPFGLHVDTPVLPVTALGSMHAAVNRITDGGRLLGEDQRISPLEALRAYTTYATLCCRGEEDRGRIEPGRYADFVLLEEDPILADPAALRDIKVRMTVCGGEPVYTA